MKKNILKRKIIVLGDGAIGGLLVINFSEEFDVVAVARKDKIPSLEENAIIFLTTKVQDSVAAVGKIISYLHNSNVIVCVQNGLGSENSVKSLVGCRVVRVVTYLAAEKTSLGQVKFVGDGGTFFERRDEDIAEIFKLAGFKTKIVANIKEKIWEKLVFNCVINGLGTILNVSNNKLDNPILDSIKREIVEECRLVAKKDGVTLNKNILQSINEFAKVSMNINSTLQDVRKGKSTEIKYLNGAVVSLGKKYGLQAPMNERIYHLIAAMTSSSFI